MYCYNETETYKSGSFTAFTKESGETTFQFDLDSLFSDYHYKATVYLPGEVYEAVKDLAVNNKNRLTIDTIVPVNIDSQDSIHFDFHIKMKNGLEFELESIKTTTKDGVQTIDRKPLKNFSCTLRP